MVKKVVLLLAAALGAAGCSDPTEPRKVLSARVTDPVCGMEVDPTASPRERFEGRLYYFCSEGCETEFKTAPAAYAGPKLPEWDVK